MMELQVILDFTCCTCSDSISVTVKCEGSSVALSGRSVARVYVPCPGCGTTHCVDFEPNGTVRGVEAERPARRPLEPFWN